MTPRLCTLYEFNKKKTVGEFSFGMKFVMIKKAFLVLYDESIFYIFLTKIRFKMVAIIMMYLFNGLNMEMG